MRCPYCEHSESKVIDSREGKKVLLYAYAGNVCIVIIDLRIMKELMKYRIWL